MILIKIEQIDNRGSSRAQKNRLAKNFLDLCSARFPMLSNNYDILLVFCTRFEWEEFYYNTLKWYCDNYHALVVVEHLQTIGEKKLSQLALYA